MSSSRLPPPPPELVRGAALFLDVDGTLLPIRERPDEVVADRALRALLERLADRLGGRLALVSGRALADLDRIFGPLKVAAAGSHGLERRDADGELRATLEVPELEQAIAALERFAASRPGVLVERKTVSVALHYRQAPEAREDCHAEADRVASETGLSLQTGKMVVELRPAGADKGSAIAAFMSEQPMAGARPLFFGDDDTDEHGFVVAAQLGGAGVLVGEQRPTAAAYRLPDVEAVRAWLEAAAQEALVRGEGEEGEEFPSPRTCLPRT